MKSSIDMSLANQFVLRPIAAVVLCAMGVLAPANAQFFSSPARQVAQAEQAQQSAAKVGRYDFAYQVQAHPRVRPVQVFDDGEHTYFQFQGGDAIPAIFKIGPTGPLLATQSFEGPYVRVEGTAGEFMVRMGSVVGRVTYTGKAGDRYQPGEYRSVSPAVARAMDAQDGPPAHVVRTSALVPTAAGPGMQVAAYGPGGGATLRMESDPFAKSSNSYAIPSKGDVAAFVSSKPQQEEYAVPFAKGSSALSPQAKKGLEKLATMIPDGASVVLVGREDDTLKEGLEQARAKAMRDVLVARGVPASMITVRLGVAEKEGASYVSHVRVIQQRPAMERGATEVASAAGGGTALARARAWQASQGVAPAVAAATNPGRGLEAPSSGFTMTPNDRTIAGAVRRWADETGYQLVWEVPKDRDPVIRGNGALRASNLKEAMEALMAGMRDKGYQIDVAIYSVNRVIVVSAPIPQGFTNMAMR